MLTKWHEKASSSAAGIWNNNFVPNGKELLSEIARGLLFIGEGDRVQWLIKK